MAALAKPTVPKVIGEGTYGFVLKPALPNINEHGKNINVSTSVTKIFKRSDNAAKAAAASNTIADITGNTTHVSFLIEEQ